MTSVFTMHKIDSTRVSDIRNAWRCPTKRRRCARPPEEYLTGNHTLARPVKNPKTFIPVMPTETSDNIMENVNMTYQHLLNLVGELPKQEGTRVVMQILNNLTNLMTDITMESQNDETENAQQMYNDSAATL